ncbi:MAG: hypothetical protein Q9185_001376 [Variospora sp. 1 TL-2023]
MASIIDGYFTVQLTHGFLVTDIFGVEDGKHTAAQVHLSTKLPTLALEDIGHHVNYVSCSETSIVLGFVTSSAKAAAIEELSAKEKFYIVTSHATCNDDGEREVYLVSGISGSKGQDLDLTLSVSPVRWKDSVQNIKINFGKSNERYHIPRQGNLQKRQTPTAPVASVVVSTPPVASTVEVSFPTPPTATPTETSASKDLAISWIDTPILPPEFPADDVLALAVPLAPPGVTVACKNCTVTGTIDILQASISGNATTSENSEDDDFFVWDAGSFTFETNGFSAHIELEATVEASASLLSYNLSLPSVGLPGFSIPGIGAVGPIFKPAVSFGTQISGGLEFGYGFDLMRIIDSEYQVPDDSSVILDLGDPTNSSVNGLYVPFFPPPNPAPPVRQLTSNRSQGSQITALPFTAGIDNIALTVSASFRPELLLGISVLTGTLGAGIFLDLPTLSATIAQVADVNSRCEPLPDTNPINSTFPPSNTTDIVNGFLDDVYSSLTHIKPAVEFGIGVLAQGEVAMLGGEVAATLFTTGLPLPTACLGFDREAGTLGAVMATSTAAAEEEDGRGTTVGGTSAAEKGFRVGRMEVAGGFLFAVGVCFLGL